MQVARAAIVHWLNDATEGTVRPVKRQSGLHIDPAAPIATRAFNIEKSRFAGDVAQCDYHAHGR
jgi:hypothetical protein